MTALPRFPGAGSLAASIRDRGFLHPRTRHPGNEQRSRRPSCPRIAVPPTVVSRVGAAPARHPEVCCDGLGCVVDGQFFVGADIAACRECVRIGVPHVRVAAVVAVVDGLAGWEDQVDIVVNADGATRTGGIDLNKPRIRAALPAALALTPAPAGFTAAEFTAKVCRLTRHDGYTTRQAAYDLRKLRGKGPHRQTRPHTPLPRPHAVGPYHRRPAGTVRPRHRPLSSPESAAHVWDANPPSGPASTAATRLSAPACRTSSATSASQPPQTAA